MNLNFTLTDMWQIFLLQPSFLMFFLLLFERQHFKMNTMSLLDTIIKLQLALSWRSSQRIDMDTCFMNVPPLCYFSSLRSFKIVFRLGPTDYYLLQAREAYRKKQTKVFNLCGKFGMIQVKEFDVTVNNILQSLPHNRFIDLTLLHLESNLGFKLL